MREPDLPAPPRRRIAISPAAGVLIAALAAGAILRLGWPGVIEYKIDESWTYARTRAMVERGEYPRLGMPSSHEVRNPGASVWIFAPIGYLFGTDSPVSLSRGVAVASLVALVGLAVFAWRRVPPHERESWYWAVSLAAVNPIAVLYHRKLWPPCAAVLLTATALVGFWYRQRRWGAALWGVAAGLGGQVHASGWVAVVGFALWAALFDRRQTRWGWLLAGGLVGLVPVVPWVQYLVGTDHETPENAFFLSRVFQVKYWLYWASEPAGIGAEYHLRDWMPEYLANPLVAGAYGLIALCSVVIVVLAVRRLRSDRPSISNWLAGGGSASGFVVQAGLFGYGLALWATLSPFTRHYLIAMFPLPFLWLARLAVPDHPTAAEQRWGRIALLGLVAAQAVLTATLLAFLHEHGSAPFPGFGTTYEQQLQEGAVTPDPGW